jgi:hypothetical protein
LRTRNLAALVALLFLHAGCIFASAWTQSEHSGQVILSVLYFQTAQQYDTTGSVQPFGYGGSFRMLLYNPYFEYGVTSKTTVSLSAPILDLKYKDQYGEESSHGFGDIEASVRRRLCSLRSPWVFSTQGTFKFPAYSVNRSPASGNHQIDLEERLLVAHGYTLPHGRSAFWDAEAAYRYRFGPPADQIRVDGSVGMDVAKRVMVIGQVFCLKGLHNGQPLQPNENPNLQSDFDLYKAQASLMLGMSKRTKMMLGWNDTFAGRNTGKGATSQVGILWSF